MLFGFMLLLVVGTMTLAQAGQENPLTLEPTTQTTAWTVRHQQQKLMVYAFPPQQNKPYVKELAPLGGTNILRDAPFDHLHHHGLMYALKVNGLDFWGEQPGSGVQKVIQTLPPQLGTNAQGQPQAVLTQRIHWVAPEAAFLPDTTPAAYLVEQRTLTLAVHEAAREVALHWQSAFEVGARTNVITLTGANYHGLGLRFLQELDPLLRHRHAGGAPDLADNRQDVTPHPWGSVGFERSGQAATLALFGHPSNARGDVWFFSMRTPFAYLAATQRLDQEPLVYRAGDKFALHYLVTVYPETKSPESLAQRGRVWQAFRP